MNLTVTQPVASDNPGVLLLSNAFSIKDKGEPSILYGGRGLHSGAPLKRTGVGEYLATMVDVVDAALDVNIFTGGPSLKSLRAKVTSTPGQMAEGRVAFVMLNAADVASEIPAGETLSIVPAVAGGC